MKITLVQPPSNRFDTSELAPPLSLLSIASVLVDDGVDVEVVDLNLIGVRDPDFVDRDFYDRAARLVAATGPDVVGFTSMALESHVCLEIARRLKKLDAGVWIVLGGPHFSAIAEPVLRHYPWVDFVVVGEGEHAVRSLLRRIRGTLPESALENVARVRGGRFHLERRLKPHASLDALPFPAYHLVDVEEYFRLNPYRVLDIEHARGCALRCSFCYSPVHWGQGEQTRRIDRILDDVHRHYELGARHLFFVADNFVNDKAFAKNLSDAMAGANPGLTWRCYATLAQLTDEIVESFARSDCKYVFIGVDAVTDASKHRFHKHYFKGWPGLRDSLSRFLDRGMTPTCAFMVNPPGEDAAEADAALGAAVHTYNLGAGVRLNPLTVYAGTGIEAETQRGACAYSAAKPELILDGHGITQDNDYARERPWLFPFHSTVGAPERYARFIATTRLCFTLLDHFPRTLMQWVHDEDRSLWAAAEEAAGRIDHARTDRRWWGIAEAEAFAEVAAARSRSARVRDALTFELAEHRLRRPANDRAVKLEIESTPIEFRLRRHAVIGLERPPPDYETTEPLGAADSAGAARYLLVPNGAAVRYLEPDEGTAALLDSLERATGTGETIRAPAARVTGLIAAGVLEPKLPDARATSTDGAAP